jgi:hypothetical protein
VQTFRTTFDISGDLELAGKAFCKSLHDRFRAAGESNHALSTRLAG